MENKCKQCGKCFSNGGSLLRHARTHAGEKPFECKQCGKCFIDRSALLVHERIHTGVKQFECKQCGKCFTHRSSLLTHERIHIREKPFECKQCGKCFANRGSLLVHERVHTGEQPFECRQCGKCFTLRSSLLTHEHIHIREKPFECKQCGARFTWGRSLFSHKRIHTEEKSFEINEQGTSFLSKNNLQNHEKIHTGRSFEKSSEAGFSEMSLFPPSHHQEQCNEGERFLPSLISVMNTHMDDEPCDILTIRNTGFSSEHKKRFAQTLTPVKTEQHQGSMSKFTSSNCALGKSCTIVKCEPIEMLTLEQPGARNAILVSEISETPTGNKVKSESIESSSSVDISLNIELCKMITLDSNRPNEKSKTFEAFDMSGKTSEMLTPTGIKVKSEPIQFLSSELTYLNNELCSKMYRPTLDSNIEKSEPCGAFSTGLGDVDSKSFEMLPPVGTEEKYEPIELSSELTYLNNELCSKMFRPTLDSNIEKSEPCGAFRTGLGDVDSKTFEMLPPVGTEVKFEPIESSSEHTYLNNKLCSNMFTLDSNIEKS